MTEWIIQYLCVKGFEIRMEPSDRIEYHIKCVVKRGNRTISAYGKTIAEALVEVFALALDKAMEG